MDRLDDEHDVRTDDFYMEVFQPISDILQPQLPDQNPISTVTMLCNNLGDKPPQYRMEETSSADCELTGPGDSGLPLKEPFHEKCPLAAALDCKVCGKVFSRASSLKKHRLTHSKERSHICKVCKKAFKRQDHLMAHMLTHLKIKPFACTEPGCSKSYCDFRSLKRHCELHHGLWTKEQKIPSANPSKVPKTTSGPPILPSSDITRCLGTGVLQQNVSSTMVVLQDPKTSLVPQTMTIHSSSEDFASRNTCTAPVDPDHVRCPDPSLLNPWWILPHKMQPKPEQPNIYTTVSFNEAAVNGGFLDPLAGHSHDHNYNCPLINNGQQTVMAQHTLTDFTRFTIQLCNNSGFHVQNAAMPMTNPQPGIPHPATLSLPSMSAPLCIPETNGILRGCRDLQGDHTGLPELSTIIGVTENASIGSQDSPAWLQPAQEGQTLSEGCQRRSDASEDTISLSLVSTVQVGPESLSPPQGNIRTYRLPVSHQEDPGEGVSNWQHKLEPMSPSIESGTWTTEDTSAGRLLIPVSVPVPRTQDKVIQREKKKRPGLKPLYIPPPMLEKISTSSGCFQSSIRAPNSVYHHNGQCQYTPPPMLSSVHHGSGLYINTSSAKYLCPRLDEKDSEGLILDNSVFAVQPHINIGDQFQAVIPECRDRSELGEDEKADLVWRPLVLTEEMSHFLNLACSNAVPGGGCNLELALHCLHCSPGNVLEALDILLDKEPQTLLPGSLTDYHYAGSDHWSLTEKCRFKNAYRKQRKNFSYIQSMIPKKSVHQCVEYYYTWKKIIHFERHQTSPPGQAPSTEQRHGGGGKQPDSGGKAKSKKTEAKEKPLYSQNGTGDPEESRKFPCQECDRVFDRVKSRNAHMKKHRMQEEKERILLYNLAKQCPTEVLPE